MTDRELLEDAAKATGVMIDGEWSDTDRMSIRGGWWNPLTDDGDALRLAVALRLTVAVRHHECEVFDDEGECLTSEPIFSASAFVSPAQATAPYAATRLAIVRAAAAIGGKP